MVIKYAFLFLTLQSCHFYKGGNQCLQWFSNVPLVFWRSGNGVASRTAFPLDHTFFLFERNPWEFSGGQQLSPAFATVVWVQSLFGETEILQVMRLGKKPNKQMTTTKKHHCFIALALTLFLFTTYKCALHTSQPLNLTQLLFCSVDVETSITNGKTKINI